MKLSKTDKRKLRLGEKIRTPKKNPEPHFWHSSSSRSILLLTNKPASRVISFILKCTAKDLVQNVDFRRTWAKLSRPAAKQCRAIVHSFNQNIRSGLKSSDNIEQIRKHFLKNNKLAKFFLTFIKEEDISRNEFFRILKSVEYQNIRVIGLEERLGDSIFIQKITKQMNDLESKLNSIGNEIKDKKKQIAKLNKEITVLEKKFSDYLIN